MAEQNKKVVRVEILHLDDHGYGPNNSMTRREWRNECYSQLKKGPLEFNRWHGNIGGYNPEYNLICDFSFRAYFEDGTDKFFYLEKHNPCYLDFIGLEFIEAFSFEGFVFNWPVNLSFSVFYSDCSFALQLHDRLDMQNADFRGRCLFKNVSSHSTIVLKKSNFQDLIINNFYVQGFLDVSNLHVENDLEVKDTEFGNLDARYLKVCGSTTIERTNFNGTTFLNNSAFREGVRFSDTVRFKAITSFDDAKFFSFTQFEKVEFGDVSFNHAHFYDLVTFRQAKFTDSSSFVNATFAGRANFQATLFTDIGRFEAAKFVGSNARIPSFRGVKNDTRLEFSQDSQFTLEDVSDDAIKDLGLLKKLSDEHGQLDQALGFNALELRAKRLNTWQSLNVNPTFASIFSFQIWHYFLRLLLIFKGEFWFCIFTYCYEKLSDFGRSFTKPLFYLFALIIISYLFGLVSAFENSPAFNVNDRQPIFSELSRRYIFDKSPNTSLVELSGYRAAMEYSLYRSGNFIDFADNDKNTASINMRLFGSNIEPWWARLFGLLKGLFTAVLLFLIALGLRNKYRVG